MADGGGTVVSRVVQMKKTDLIIFHRLSVLPASAAEHSICSAEFVAQVVVSALTCCSPMTEAEKAEYVCSRSSLEAASTAGRMDISPIRCKACDELTGMQCDLCQDPICGMHSVPFAYNPDSDELATRICYECHLQDTTASGIAPRR